MQAGRIETYVHSDSVTPNKGAAVVRVLAQTDFAARTPSFVTFAQLAARLAYAAQAKTWEDVVVAYPEMAEALPVLRRELREDVGVDEIVLLRL